MAVRSENLVRNVQIFGVPNDKASRRRLNFVRLCRIFVGRQNGNLPRFTHPEPRILIWLMDFWTTCALLRAFTTVV